MKTGRSAFHLIFQNNLKGFVSAATLNEPATTAARLGAMAEFKTRKANELLAKLEKGELHDQQTDEPDPK